MRLYIYAVTITSPWQALTKNLWFRSPWRSLPLNSQQHFMRSQNKGNKDKPY